MGTRCHSPAKIRDHAPSTAFLLWLTKWNLSLESLPRGLKKKLLKSAQQLLCIWRQLSILPVYFSKIDLLNKCYNHNQMFILIH